MKVKQLSIFLENKPGALLRVTGLLSARGYNIESLTVARTLDPTLSRMSIVVDVDPTLRAQVIKQMNKLVNVLQAADLTESSAIRRELLLLRVRAQQDGRTEILKEAEAPQLVDAAVHARDVQRVRMRARLERGLISGPHIGNEVLERPDLESV